MKLSGTGTKLTVAAPIQLAVRPNTPYRIQFDGSIAVNPGGDMGWGWAFLDGDETVYHGFEGAPAAQENTVNVAEYNGLISALEHLLWVLDEDISEVTPEAITIEGDSKLVIKQVKGLWKVNKSHLRDLAERVSSLVKRLHRQHNVNVFFRWVPRELNEKADEYSKYGREAL